MQKRQLHQSRWLGFVLYAVIGSIVFNGTGCKDQDNPTTESYLEYRKQEFNRLAVIREKKADDVLYWLDKQKSIAGDPETVSKLTQYFFQFRASTTGRFDKEHFSQLNSDVERFLAYDLCSFYDILFFNAEGTVFYSIKMEDDFQKSFVDGPYSNTKLAKMIQQRPEQLSFIGYCYYGASDEPAAFYVFPIKQKSLYCGSIAIQLSINHLNHLLTERSGLGRTGETYLVNEKHLMLTESRFINNDIVLSKRIDTEAIRNELDSVGSKVIDDYRGVRVLSSYQTVQAGNSNWRILAEIDEDEVLTDYYRHYSDTLFPKLLQLIKKHTQLAPRTTDNYPETSKQTKRVDTGELVRSDDRRKVLFSPGIAPCTGIVARMVHNDITYMAHLSPIDVSYHVPEGEVIPLGYKSSDLVSLLIRRILYFEIKPCQIDKLRFEIVAPHSNSIKKIVDNLTNAGISLSQIKVAILDQASSVSIFYDPSDRITLSRWYNCNSPGRLSEGITFTSIPSLGDLARQL